MNQRVKYLGQRSFSSNIIVRTHTHTFQTDCCAWTTEVVSSFLANAVVLVVELLS